MMEENCMDGSKAQNAKSGTLMVYISDFYTIVHQKEKHVQNLSNERRKLQLQKNYAPLSKAFIQLMERW